MKNFVRLTICVLLAFIFTFLTVVYTDFAIKKDGYSGNENFIEFTEKEIRVCFFGEVCKADIEKIGNILKETKIRRLKGYC